MRLLAAVPLLFSLAGPLQAAPAPLPPELRRVQALMGTVLEIRAWGPGEELVNDAITAAFAEVARLEDVFSLYRPGSDLSRFNAAPAGTAVAVAPEILELTNRSLAYREQTEGAFDVTIEPLARFWRSGGEWTPDEWKRSAADVGFARFEIDENHDTITRLKSGAGLNFDGIAKGAALDRAADILKKGGVTAARLNFGGQILAVGAQPEEPLEIADPATGAPLVSFSFDRGSVSTSSQHERTASSGGRRWGHIIDPRTRRVVEREGSVTVLASSAEEADALSTALLVLGPEDGNFVITAHYPKAAALFIEKIRGGWRVTPTAKFPKSSLRVLHDDAQIVLP